MRNLVILAERCKKLEELGFTIHHWDSNVSIGEGDNYIEFDFSAIHEDKFVQEAVRLAWENGHRTGSAEVKLNIRKLIGLEP